jgi:hypothetical protein
MGRREIVLERRTLLSLLSPSPITGYGMIFVVLMISARLRMNE